MNQDNQKYLIVRIITATACRLVINTARRFIYPFAPLLSRELNVPLTAITSMIALNQTTGLVGLASGPLADRWGHRRMMRTAMALLAVGMLMCAVAPTYGLVFAGVMFAGVAKTIYDPAIQAYVGHQVAFRRRAMAIGSIETAWAGSTLIGIPVMAVLIDEIGLRWSFGAMALFGALGFILLAVVIPDDSSERSGLSQRPGILASLGQLIRIRPAAGMLGTAFWLSMGNDNLFVVFGVWLEQDFGVGLIALGLSSGVIGVAELLGESATALWADRMGLKRALVVGLLLTTIAYLLLPIVGTTMPGALMGLFLLFLGFEFTIVCSFSLSTELLPSTRATMMAGVLAAAGLGRMVGALTGGHLWLLFGIWGVSLTSVIASALAMMCLIWGLRGWRETHP